MMTYVTIDKTRCFGLATCGECLQHIDSSIHTGIAFHGVLLVSEPRWDGEEGNAIRSAMNGCPVGAIVVDR